MATVAVAPSLADIYQSAAPFPHIVLDDLFCPERLRSVVAEIGATDPSDGHDAYASFRKRGISTWEGFGTATRRLIEQLNSPAFVAWLSETTGIPGLIADPGLMGGGVHQIRRGGFLKIHTDFNWHSGLKLHRRVNLLLYLNPDWRAEWGGALELWPPDMSRCGASIMPAFNRAVIFSTTDQSYHGHPEPLQCPEHVRRNSIALYYYSAEPAPSRFGRSEMTNYRERPGEHFASMKHKAHQLLIRTGLGSAAVRLRGR